MHEKAALWIKLTPALVCPGLDKHGPQWESCETRSTAPMTTVDIDSLLAQDEVRALLESCEHAGTIRAPSSRRSSSARARRRSSTKRCCASSTSAASRSSTRRAGAAPGSAPAAETTTDALQLFLREAGRHRC